MKISIDGGGLCTDKNNRFGNYIFTENLIKAVQQYEKSNQYFVYAFCRKPKFVKESNNLIYKNLQPKLGWSRVRTSIEEITSKKDVFLALNQSIPLITNSRIISFSHGLSFHFFPKLYPDSFKQLTKQLDQMLLRSHKIIVSSIKVKNELLSINRVIDAKIKVILYGVPLDMVEEKSKINSDLIGIKNQKSKFFLFVGMNHPTKNIEYIKDSFKKFQSSKVGKEFKLIIADHISRTKLKQLYRQATALLTASLYESFNLPVLEALAQNCPVIGLKSAIIPELTPYVNIVKDQSEFILIMKKAALNNLKPINIKKITQKFSWKNYVYNLSQQYTTMF